MSDIDLDAIEARDAAAFSDSRVRNQAMRDRRVLLDALRAAEAREARLDVDRVARVLEEMELDCDPDGHITHSTCDHDEQAEDFARRYAALAEPQP